MMTYTSGKDTGAGDHFHYVGSMEPLKPPVCSPVPINSKENLQISLNKLQNMNSDETRWDMLYMTYQANDFELVFSHLKKRFKVGSNCSGSYVSYKLLNLRSYFQTECLTLYENLPAPQQSMTRTFRLSKWIIVDRNFYYSTH